MMNHHVIDQVTLYGKGDYLMLCKTVSRWQDAAADALILVH